MRAVTALRTSSKKPACQDSMWRLFSWGTSPWCVWHLCQRSQEGAGNCGIAGFRAKRRPHDHPTLEPCGQDTPRKKGEDWNWKTTFVTGIAKQQGPLTCFLTLFLHLGIKDAAHSWWFSGLFSSTSATLPFRWGLTGRRCVDGASHSRCKSEPDIVGLMEERDSQSPRPRVSESDSETRVGWTKRERVDGEGEGGKACQQHKMSSL